MKLWIRNIVANRIARFGPKIRDAYNGELLGRGLVVALGSKVWVIGYSGEKPLAPVFLPQTRLCYWKQGLGFTTRELPEFTRVDENY